MSQDASYLYSRALRNFQVKYCEIVAVLANVLQYYLLFVKETQ